MKRIRILLLFGLLAILVISVRVGYSNRSVFNFKRCQQLGYQNPEKPEIFVGNVMRRKVPHATIYVINVERDNYFHPNKFIIITRLVSGFVMVELLSGPGPEFTLVLVGQDAINYLASTGLDLH